MHSPTWYPSSVFEAGGTASARHASHLGMAFTRRQFLKATGATAAAAAMTPLFGGPAFASSGARIPKPIPYSSPVLADLLGVDLPFFLPVEIDPFLGVFDPVSDPSTIGDFKGRVGMVEVEGVSDNNSEHVPRTWAADIRYMEGRYVDREGKERRGAFGFF